MRACAPSVRRGIASAGSSSGEWRRPITFGRCSLRAAATAAILLFLSPALRAQDRFRLELFHGTAYSAPSSLTIDQGGQDRISFSAHWVTRRLADAPYFAARIGLWGGKTGWELQFLHHKMYLTNGPPEIERFEITHGWNLLTIQRATHARLLDWRVGVGPVIAHADGTIRGEDVDRGGGLFGHGYYLSGAGAIAGAGKSVKIWRGLRATAEGQVTASWARIPLFQKSGHASTANYAFHFLVGLGFGI